MRKRTVDDINLHIETVEVSKNFILFTWISDIGFGEYQLYYDHEAEQWKAYTELMDSGDNKAFGRKLFELFMDKVKVIDVDTIPF